MNRVAAVVLAVAALAVNGCAIHTIRVSDPGHLEELNRELDGRDARIVLSDGERIRADSVTARPSGVVEWTDPATGDHVSAGPCEVGSIEVPRRGRGVLKGLLVGAAAGIVLSYGLDHGDRSSPSVGLSWMWHITAPAVGCASGAMVMGALERDVYKLDVPPSVWEKTEDTLQK